MPIKLCFTDVSSLNKETGLTSLHYMLHVLFIREVVALHMQGCYNVSYYSCFVVPHHQKLYTAFLKITF